MLFRSKESTLEPLSNGTEVQEPEGTRRCIVCIGRGGPRFGNCNLIPCRGSVKNELLGELVLQTHLIQCALSCANERAKPKYDNRRRVQSESESRYTVPNARADLCRCQTSRSTCVAPCATRPRSAFLSAVHILAVHPLLFHASRCLEHTFVSTSLLSTDAAWHGSHPTPKEEKPVGYCAQ